MSLFGSIKCIPLSASWITNGDSSSSSRLHMEMSLPVDMRILSIISIASSLFFDLINIARSISDLLCGVPLAYEP